MFKGEKIRSHIVPAIFDLSDYLRSSTFLQSLREGSREFHKLRVL